MHRKIITRILKCISNTWIALNLCDFDLCILLLIYIKNIRLGDRDRDLHTEIVSNSKIPIFIQKRTYYSEF